MSHKETLKDESLSKMSEELKRNILSNPQHGIDSNIIFVKRRIDIFQMIFQFGWEWKLLLYLIISDCPWKLKIFIFVGYLNPWLNKIIAIAKYDSVLKRHQILLLLERSANYCSLLANQVWLHISFWFQMTKDKFIQRYIACKEI